LLDAKSFVEPFGHAPQGELTIASLRAFIAHHYA
jgi:hypothetical protein